MNYMYNPTCFFTGEKSNLKMHSLRNDNGDMIGWIFVQNAIDLKDSEINHTYKINESAKLTIDMINLINNVHKTNETKPNEETVPDEYWSGGFASNH